MLGKQEFKATFRYIAGSRTAWAIQNPVSKKNSRILRWSALNSILGLEDSRIPMF